jgi:hypothetical protein
VVLATRSYEGEIRNGIREGKGVFYKAFNRLHCYEGDWKCDKFDGYAAPESYFILRFLVLG